VSARTELLRKINAEVNAYPYETDETVWGKPDFWEKISTMKRGDCEDYVLEKRWQLQEAGVSLDDMRIGIVQTETDECHAVLIVADPAEGGDWVLDQRQPDLVTQDQLHGLGYKGDQLQIPNSWIWERWVI
jgi:predicted transglutaminase-like cysteine proteinase